MCYGKEVPLNTTKIIYFLVFLFFHAVPFSKGCFCFSSPVVIFLPYDLKCLVVAVHGADSLAYGLCLVLAS